MHKTISIPTKQNPHGLNRSDFPDAPFPDPALFTLLGEEKIIALVKVHHQLMRQSDIGAVFGQDEAHFQRTIQHTADYFVEMFGGPKRFTPHRGEPKLGKRHRPFALQAHHREGWLNCLAQAMQECHLPQEAKQMIWNWVEPLSMRFLTPIPLPETLKRWRSPEDILRPRLESEKKHHAD